MMSSQTANAQTRIEGADDLQFIQAMYRRLSLPFANGLAKFTSITPNQITIASFAIGCIAGVFFACGTYRCAVIASFLLFTSLILDYVDGHLARILNRKSALGHWLNIALERGVDFFVIVGIVVGVGLQEFAIGNYLAAVLFAASRFLIDTTYFSAILVAPYLKDNYHNIKRRQRVTNVIFRQCVYTRVSVLTLAVLFALSDCLSYYLYFMAVYGVGWYGCSLIYISTKIHRHDTSTVEKE